MPGHSQSAPRRALEDTFAAQRTTRFMWGGEGVLAVAGGAWLTALAPSSASVAEQIIRAVIGGMGGLLAAIIVILAWNLAIAPYRQRNEARELIQGGDDIGAAIRRLSNLSVVHGEDNTIGVD